MERTIYAYHQYYDSHFRPANINISPAVTTHRFQAAETWLKSSQQRYHMSLRGRPAPIIPHTPQLSSFRRCRGAITPYLPADDWITCRVALNHDTPAVHSARLEQVLLSHDRHSRTRLTIWKLAPRRATGRRSPAIMIPGTQHTDARLAVVGLRRCSCDVHARQTDRYWYWYWYWCWWPLIHAYVIHL